MNLLERKSIGIIASIYAFRMLGLFMILPIFSLYAERLAGATPLLIGFALGIYGLTQAILQIPFGMCSDYVGRKPVIIFGLVLFLIGSIVAALAHDIQFVIVGRALQGAGAIGSTLIALVSDTTEDEQRLKAMAIIGMTIGFSFILAMILGPLLNGIIGLSGVFAVTAVLALLGIIMINFIPTPKKQYFHPEAEPVLSQFKVILGMPELLRLDFGIFTLHAILTSLFIVIPIVLTKDMGLNVHDQWLLYVPVLIVAYLLMIPFIIMAEKKRMMKPVFIGAIVVLTWCVLLFDIFQKNIFMLTILLCLFFAAFTLLEASLPSLVSKIAPIRSKGTAMGVYSSAQFLGIFFGGSVGGFLLNSFDTRSLFIFCGVLGVTWAVLAVTMQPPRHLSSKVVSLKKAAITPELEMNLTKELLAVPGVYEVMINKVEASAYLKIDKQEFSQESLDRIIG